MSASSQLSPEDRKRVRTLAFIAAGLGVTHVIAMLLYYGDFVEDYVHVSFFDLDEEESFGTWFSAVILLYAGRLLLRHARSADAAGDRWHRWWLFLAIGFHVLSIDEVAAMHEYVNTIVESTKWTTFGAALVAVVGVAYIPFLRALPARTRFLFIVAGALYVGGAVGVERATDWYDVHDLLNTLTYNLWTAVEEVMEMSGVIVFIYALLLLGAGRTTKTS